MNKNENGSALITVVIIITITVIFLSILFLYSVYQRRMVANLGYQTQTYHNAKSAVLLALQKYNSFTPKKYTFHFQQNDSTSVHIEPYGLFLRATAVSKIKDIQSSRTFLIGQKQDARFKAALILGDVDNPLVVAGNTLIRGDVLVGLAGVKPGVLKGRRFRGEKTIIGKMIRKRTSSLPSFNKQLIESQIDRLQHFYPTALSNAIYHFPKLKLNNGSMVLSTDILRSLQEQGLKSIIGPGTIFVEGKISISNIYLQGPITVFSENEVLLDQSFSSKNVLWFTQSLIISSQSEMSGQFYANRKITINSGVHLSYPSVVGVISESANQLTISEKAIVNGSVLLSGENDPKLIINENAIINGVIYSDNYTELRGVVNGSVLTQSFYMYEAPTVYINWINNATIDRAYLKEDMALPLGFKIEKNYDIIIEE
jgi:cytoskeletal protein CcmA (bactofilin family)